MSFTPAEIKEQQNIWKFKITKDSENPVLLEFNNFYGKKKSASPAFLMSLLLKEHIKAIEKEIGEQPKELRFCLFPPHSEVEEEKKKRIEKEIKESCKLINVECSFFDV